MKIKIYYNDKPVFLCNKLDEELMALNHHPDVLYIDELSTPAFHSIQHALNNDQCNAAILFHENIDELKAVYFKQYTFIHAAGGIVQNENKDVLFIFRKGKWDLPKGKIDKSEHPETAAIREITEETGVQNLLLHQKIGETYHVYHAFGKHFIKQTDWFYLTCSGVQNLLPQIEEDITKVTFIPTKNIRIATNQTYAAIKDILRTFFDTP